MTEDYKAKFESLHQAGHINEALALAKEQYELAPDDDFWICWLGNYLRLTGQWRAAKQHWEAKVGFLTAVHAPLLRDLGNTVLADLLSQGTMAAQQRFTFHEAATTLFVSCQLKPNAKTLNNLAVALELAGDHSGAGFAIELALALEPELPEIQGNLYILELAKQSSKEPFVATQRDQGELEWQCGSILYEQKQIFKAGTLARKALDKLAKIWDCDPSSKEIACLINELEFLPYVYHSQDHATATLQKSNELVARLDSITKLAHLQREEDIKLCTYAAFTVTGFYRSYLLQNNRQYFVKFSNSLQRCLNLAPRTSSLYPKKLPNQKIRIGIASSRIKNFNGVVGTLKWFENLSKNEYEFFIYHMTTSGESDNDLVTNRFSELGDYKLLHITPDSLSAKVEFLRKDNLDALFILDIGMDILNRILSLVRIAPLQCLSWGHPDTTGSSCMDAFLSGAAMEPENGQEHYSEELIALPNLGWNLEPPEAPDPANYFKLDEYSPEGCTTRLGSLQSLFKYAPKYDNVFRQILKQSPGAHLFFISCDNTQQDGILLKRLEDNDNELKGRIHCLPRMPDPQYISLFAQLDVNLDSLGWSGGFTSQRAFVMGCPTVTFAGELMRGRHTMAMLQIMGLDELIAHTEADYIAITLRLIREPEFRSDVSERIRENSHKLFNDMSCVEALDKFLKQRVAANRAKAATQSCT
jgi:predicted O-linked N-acetylglucosamine transferase (SPINDLY family)